MIDKRSRCCLHSLLRSDQASKFCSRKKKISSVFGSELRNKISWAGEKAMKIAGGRTEPGTFKLTSACQAFAHSRKKTTCFCERLWEAVARCPTFEPNQTESRMFFWLVCFSPFDAADVEWVFIGDRRWRSDNLVSGIAEFFSAQVLDGRHGPRQRLLMASSH